MLAVGRSGGEPVVAAGVEEVSLAAGESGLICILLLKRLFARDAPRFAFRMRKPILGHDPEKWKPVFRKDHAHQITRAAIDSV